jgi:hydroxypyruvate isomerase
MLRACHLIWMGADPLAAVDALGEPIFHVHAKDTWLNPARQATTSLLENGPLADVAARPWSYVTLGYGHDEHWWRALCYRLRLAGYDGWLSIEHEDVMLSRLEGVHRSRRAISPCSRSEEVSATFTLAACAEMLFLDLPVVERVRKIAALGFQVEIWDWTRHDIEALVRTGATFSSMTGYIHGDLVEEDGAAALLRTAEQSIGVAKRLDCPRLNLHGTGLGERGLPVKPVHEVTGAMWLKARATLARIADLGERAGVTFVLENLNTAVDHPGVPFARAADTLALVEAVGSRALRLNLDLYHAQIGEGNLIELLRRAAPFIGEIQVADVPGRCEPGTGEINYPAIARALEAIGYRGTIGLEAWASGDSELALERFRRAFTPPA